MSQPLQDEIAPLHLCVDCQRYEGPHVPGGQRADGVWRCDECQAKLGHSAGPMPPTSPPRVGASGVVLPDTPISASPAKAPPGSYYEELGLAMGASADEIMEVLGRVMEYWDERYGDPQRDLKVAHYNDIFRVLTDPTERAHYDQSLRRARAERPVNPLDDFRNERVDSIKTLIATCEKNQTNWQLGEQLLKTRVLYDWFRVSLRDDDATQIIREVIQTPHLSYFQRLNMLLYRLDPERPYRFFQQPDRYDQAAITFVTREMGQKQDITTPTSIVTFADASGHNWSRVRDHLYRGYLLTWLRQSLNFRGRYQQDGLQQFILWPQEFFETVCQPFQDSPEEDIGVEAFLHYLDRKLDYPQLEVTFDDQKGSYTLPEWDKEIEHQPVAVVIRNVTRGYFSGTIALAPPAAQDPSFPWVDFTYLTPRIDMTPRGAPRPASPPAPHPVTPPPHAFRLFGSSSQHSRSIYLGYMVELAYGRTYQRQMELRQVAGRPGQTNTVGKGYPITLELMRYRAGYRAKLWEQGLRGDYPGLLLDGGLGFGIGLLVFVLGAIFAPHASWGFLSPGRDWTGQINASVIIDGVLVTCLRPFYLAVGLLGFWLPTLMGIMFALTGYFTGLRSRFGPYNVPHEGNVFRANDDLKRHERIGGWTAFLFVVLASAILLVGESLRFHLKVPYSIAQHVPRPWFIADAAFSEQTYGWVYFGLVAFPPIVVLIAMRVVNAFRQEHYQRVAKLWGNEGTEKPLLRPQGRKG